MFKFIEGANLTIIENMSGLAPTYQAYTTFGENDNEVVDKYRFRILDKNGIMVKDDSDWILRTKDLERDTY